MNYNYTCSFAEHDLLSWSSPRNFCLELMRDHKFPLARKRDAIFLQAMQFSHWQHRSTVGWVSGLGSVLG
jgi:hypothetical protein